MENLRQDYRRLYNEAKAINHDYRVRELFEALLDELNIADLSQESASAKRGKAAAEAANKRDNPGSQPEAKKL